MIEPGIHQLPADRYHRDEIAEIPSLSAGICRLLANSTPLHAWTAHPRLNPAYESEEKSIFDLGTVAHDLVIEGTDERVVVIEADSWRTKDAQAQRDQARADGKLPLLAKDWARTRAMVAAIRMQLELRGERKIDVPPLLTDGVAEPTVVWEERGVVCRARPDWLRRDLAAADDLKTTGQSANPTLWGRKTMWRQGFPIQVAFNLRGLKALTGAQPEWRYIVVENTPPFAMSVVSLDSSALELANAMVDRAIDKWRECLEADSWPGYPLGTYHAEMPAWAELEFLENDAEAMTA